MSDTPNAPPSVDPANDDSMLGMANTILRKFLQRVDDMLPARVVSYDRATNLAVLAPMVALLTTAGAQVARAQIAAVPVLLLGGGGHMLSFNLKPGDLGWLKACDRDISMFLQSWSGGPPNTLRMHTFEDAMFIPDAMRGYTIAPEDAERAVLQSLDGNVKVALGANALELSVGAASITMTAAGTVVTGPLIINGVIFNSHVHTGVQPGAGNTGLPI